MKLNIDLNFFMKAKSLMNKNLFLCALILMT